MCDLIPSSLNSRGSWQCWTQNAILEQACWEKLVCSSTCCLSSARLGSVLRPRIATERGEDILKLSAPSARALFASDQRSERIKGKEAEWPKGCSGGGSCETQWNILLVVPFFSELKVLCSAAFRGSSYLKLESRHRLVNACCCTLHWLALAVICDIMG